MSVVSAWIATLIGAFALERFTTPRSPYLAATTLAFLMRLFVITLVFGFFFACSWRPLFALFTTMIFVGVFTLICRGKVWFVHEPLVFSDIAFIIDVFRYPKLFYSTFLHPLNIALVLTAFVSAVAFWFYLEPSVLPADDAGLAVAGGLVGWAIALSLLFLPVTRRVFESWALAICRDPDVEHDIAAFGHLATLLIHFLAWRGDDRKKRIARWTPPPDISNKHDGVSAADLIVVAQCESFYDFRRLGMTDLSFEELDAARARAVSWGRLGSSFEGGYTLRTEFSFLTGRAPSDIGFDRYYPYLNAKAYRGIAVPRALSQLGYRTVFMHPYHRGFFLRDTAMPALGFERIIMLDEFSGAEIKGEHVSDAAVADRLISEAHATKGPAFLFAATMENHGPWEPERFLDTETPVDVYKKHLMSGDALLGRLIREFDDWPGRVVLLFYGDHVPVLKSYADPFPDERTDYVVLELGRDADKSRKAIEQPRTINQLTWDVLALAGLTAPEAGDKSS